jgi:hypothetical protein
VTVFDRSTHTAEEAARAVGAELGQIVKSLVFVLPDDEAEASRSCLVSGRTGSTSAGSQPSSADPTYGGRTPARGERPDRVRHRRDPPFGHTRRVRW